MLLLFSFACPSLSLVRFRYPITLLHYADKRTVNIIKVYIERNKLKPELIRCIKNVDSIHVYFCKATDSMLYRALSAYQEVLNTNHFNAVSESRPTRGHESIHG